jgi:hypothetical protein
LAIGLLISSEMMAPPKPITSGKAQQAAQVQAVGGEEAVDAQQAGGDAQHQHHGQVGDDEQQDALHGGGGPSGPQRVADKRDVRARR